ncbi:MAG: hypothetical protein JWN94_1949 [Betaproteobacteria bacterium]|nr:hypothetical protein [Betaproteobacteria bacterium]
MDMHGTHTKHELSRHGGLALDAASGRTVTCVSGNIWLTMEGDTRDVVIEPGASFVIDRGGLTLLAAQTPSVVLISAAKRAPAGFARIARWFLDTYGPAAVRPSRTWAY